MKNKIEMKRSDALEWVKLAIERGKYNVAIEILDDLIKQEKECEAEGHSNPPHLEGE